MSNVKHINPYHKDSSYHAAFAIAQKSQVISLPEWIKKTAEATGKDLKLAAYDVNVVRSPSKDKWGSRSADGADSYFESCVRKVVDGVKEPIKERLRWREVSMVNPYAKAKVAKVEVKAEKTKVTTKTKKAKKVVAKKKAVKKVKAITEVSVAPVIVTPETTPVSVVAPEVIA